MSAKKTPLQKALRTCYPALVSTFVISLFINLSMLASPLYSMQVYDRVLASRNISTLGMLTLIVVMFLLLYGVLEFARSGLLVRTGMQFEAMLRRPLFDTMMRAEMSPRHRQGQQVIRDAETIREAFSAGTVATLFDLPWTPVYVILCFFLHPMLGIVALIGTVLIFLLALANEFATRGALDETNRRASQAFGFAASTLRNGEVVRGLGMGNIMLNRWSGKQSAVIAAHSKAYERGAALHAVTKFMRLTLQTALMCTGAWLAIEGEISPGVILASSIIMGRALMPIEQVVGQWKRIVACRSAFRRISKLFRDVPEAPKATNLPAPIGKLDVENVVVWPPIAKTPSVKGVSFSLEPGESMAIVGASGSGKSSLARALAGVWALGNGSIRIDGASTTQWDPNKLGKYIGYLPQDIDLFSGTIAENIARMGDVDDMAVIRAAKAAGAHDVVLRLPMGYDTPIGDSGIALSGGMRQRVGLARALYGNPRVIVLDEPNSNLDDEGEKALARAMMAMKAAKCTVIVITHRPHLLSHVEKLLVMSFGQKIAFGPRDEVIANMRGNRSIVDDSNKTAGDAPQIEADQTKVAAAPAPQIENTPVDQAKAQVEKQV